jgi:hypothetical protein
MTAPLLVLRVGYMERYDGPDTITSGGAYIAENGVGGEVFNFKPSRGNCYGYAMSRRLAGLNLRFIDDSKSWREGGELSGVDVVFIARRPSMGQVVVGWYRNATVFHRQYRVRRGTIPGMNEAVRRFLCVADANDVRLLPEEARTFDVPYAPAGFKGFPGQSNVWYPNHHADQPGVAAFIHRLTKYIDSTPGVALPEDETPGGKSGGKRGRTSTPDHAHNAMVEAAAVNAVWARYEADGYTVKSVETECVGWDLEATKGRQSLKLEVKGTAGAAIYFELTPNEYAKLKEHAAGYRVCVVCEALTKPRIFDLTPEAVGSGWRLVSVLDQVSVPLMERIAAIGAEVAPCAEVA